jgi:hypothetical protein
MRTVLLLALALTSAAVSAGTPDPVISATGTLYLTFDIGMGNDLEGTLVARFVPDAKSLSQFPAVSTGQYPGAVRYITLKPSTGVLERLVGADEAARLSHDRERIVQLPVRIELNHYKAVIECDARAYRATLVSVNPAGEDYWVTPRDSAPIGC